MIISPHHSGEIGKHLTAWIDMLAPSGISGVEMDGQTTRDLVALLVACRASIAPTPTIVDLTAADYAVGGTS